MQNTKFYTAFLILVIFAGIFSLSPAFSSLMSGVVVGNTGQISTDAYAYAKSGSPQDIQAAVDAVAAKGGGIVFVPAGDFVFNPIDAPSGEGVQILGGVSIIGAGKDVTILRQTEEPPQGSAMFRVDGQNGEPTRVSGITFIGYVSSEDSESVGVNMWCCKDFRVDHCKFVDFTAVGISTGTYTVVVGEQYYWNWGVIDHCDFDNPYKDIIGGIWGYGVGVHGPGREDAWLYNLSDIIGQFPENPPNCALYQWNAGQQKYDLVSQYGGKQFRWLVYIENCNFSRCRHSIASNGEAWYVARYNTFMEPRPKDYPMIDVHGALSAQGWGGRGAEVYNNTIYAAAGYSSSCAIDYRGGGGVVFNNKIINCKYGVRLSREPNYNPVCNVKDLWIWNNIYQNVEVSIHDMYDFYEEEVHYFLRARPNYTPYTYPHPLTLEIAP